MERIKALYKQVSETPIFMRLKETYQQWDEDEAQTWAASITFFTVLSLAPLLILAVAIAGFIFGEDAATGELALQMEDLMGQAGAEVFQSAIASSSTSGSNSGIIAGVISLAVLLWGASKVFGQLRKALNRVWGVRLDPNIGWRGLIIKHVTGFTMVLAVGFLLLLSIIVSAVLSGMEAFFGEAFELPGLWDAANFVVSLVLVAGVFAALFRFVPDVDIEWPDVRFGALVTAILFTVGKFVLGIYLGSASVGSAYGAAGSLVVLLVWVYYSAQIFFFGAEYTQVHARWRDREIGPSEHAIAINEQRCKPRKAPEKVTS